MRILRLAAVLTVVGLAAFVAVNLRRERAKRRT
jgi:hypothetical protein